MLHFPHGAFVAINAAQEQQRRDKEEEEEMTRYSVDELDSNWEFKIVRSEAGAFRKPEVFNVLLQEESIAGWELVEKLDNRRVRFKRPQDTRRRDATLPPGFDPYRSHYGSAGGTRTAVLIGTALMLALGVAFAVLFSTGVDTGSSADSIPWIIVTLGGVVFLLVGVAIVAIRRSQ